MESNNVTGNYYCQNSAENQGGMNSSRSHYFDANSIVFNNSLKLEDTMSEVQIALNLFLDNKFELAEARLAVLANESMYHAMGYSTLIFIKAVLTCDRKDIALGINTIRSACNVIGKFRASYSIRSALCKVSGQSPSLTNEEMHAELCFAEVLMFRAILTFLSDDEFSSFFVGAFKIRTCYQIYKECYKILKIGTYWQDSTNLKLKRQFECGTRMGIGMFNLLLSTLPTKLLRFLEIVGFSGNKAIGYKELSYASLIDGTIRSPMASLALLSWHLFASYIIGIGEPDIPLCKKLVRPFINNYPNGAITLFFKARISLVSGDFMNAIYFYNISIKLQHSYPQFHHACHWELMFTYCYCRRWDRAANYAKHLLDESKWSLCVYTYFLAILINVDEKTPKRNETVKMLLKQVPSTRLRIAGKSIPMEKFCESKAVRYERYNELYWPHYEFLYFWNGFSIIEQSKHCLIPVLEDIESYWKLHHSHNIDDHCLYYFLKGVCLKGIGEFAKADRCLINVVENQKNVVDFVYLIPFSYFELASIHRKKGHIKDVLQYLAKARAFRGYPLETKLHFRIHNFMEKLFL